MDLGGRDITEYMMLLLRRLGYNFHTSAEFEIVKKIKENRCTLKELTKE
jgi:centractin